MDKWIRDELLQIVGKSHQGHKNHSVLFRRCGGDWSFIYTGTMSIRLDNGSSSITNPHVREHEHTRRSKGLSDKRSVPHWTFIRHFRIICILKKSDLPNREQWRPQMFPGSTSGSTSGLKPSSPLAFCLTRSPEGGVVVVDGILERPD